MTQPQIEIQIIASLVAVACALPGVFLVLRKMSMISDAISHAILPGIVIGFLLTGTINSGLLVILAAASGMLTVVLVELIRSTRLVSKDTAIGLVFPALFSIGVILISTRMGNIHLDTDTVLLGEIAFAPFDRMILGGMDLGPKNAWVIGIIMIINLTFILIFYKELKLSTFDVSLAASFGFMPMALNYGLMGMVSVTTVGAFDAVGAILVVAFMIAPAATAYLITDRLSSMLIISVITGIITAISGYWAARFFDVSIAGTMATMSGVIFFISYLLAPQRGVLRIMRRRRQQKLELAQMTLAVHIYNHSGGSEINERKVVHLREHFRWKPHFINKVIKKSQNKGIIRLENGIINITEKGVRFTEAADTMINPGYNPEFDALRKEFMILSD